MNINTKLGILRTQKPEGVDSTDWSIATLGSMGGERRQVSEAGE